MVLKVMVGNVSRHFLRHSCGEGVLLASSGWMPGILLGETSYNAQDSSSQQRNYLPPNVSVAETGKPWPKEISEEGYVHF